MNRDEYIKNLRTFIQPVLTLEEQEEALQYYMDYFEEADDDEKVMKELGTPEELAKTIIEKFANVPVASVKEKNTNDNSEDEDENERQEQFGFDALYYSFPKDKVRCLNLGFGASEVVMVSGDEFSVETRGVQKQFMRCNLSSDGVLTINNHKGFNLYFFSHERRTRIIPRVLITVPENFDFDKVKIAVGAGKFELKDCQLKYRSADFSVSAGDLRLNSVCGNKTDIHCGIGNFVLSGKLFNKINVDCGMGSVKLSLKGKPSDYSYDAKVGIGEFKFNDEKKNGLCQSLCDVKKDNHFSVNCGMGSVNITVHND